MNEIDYDNEKEEFDNWFTGVLFEQESCLHRDILRNQKAALYQEWLLIRPHDPSVLNRDKQGRAL